MAELRISEVEFPTLLSVGAWPDTLNEVQSVLRTTCGYAAAFAPGRFSSDGQHRDDFIACLAPGRFLVASHASELSAQVITAFSNETAVVVELSHSRSAFRVSGQDVERLLMKGVAIDLREQIFRVGSLFQSSIHDIGVIGLRRSSASFDLFVYQSFAASFEHWLFDAALEFGGVADAEALLR